MFTLVRENEKPLDTVSENGGYTAIFRTIACIGDSLSSGEFESDAGDGKSNYHDMFEYSWGQFIARMCGSTVYNLSRGGMTASEFCQSFADNMGFWNAKYASQAYIVALGVNDLFGQNRTIGSTADICDDDPEKNETTFAGYYAKILQKMKKIQPRAKFFLMTMPKESHDNEERTQKKLAHRTLLYDFAKKFENTYVLDLYEYAPVYDEEFKRCMFMRGHLNPMGYLYTARLVSSYIDYIIRKNPEDFAEVGFIGTSLYR